jgi:hypothetical protein
MTRRTTAATAIAAVSLLALGACGTGSSSTATPPTSSTPSDSATATDTATAPTTGDASPVAGDATTAATGTASPMSVRFANLYSQAGKPGPALDIYDTPQYQAATPLVAGLAYGAVSDYVNPHIPANSVTDAAIFYALPAGEDPVADSKDAVGIGGVEDDGSHPQKTFLLEPSSDSNELTSTPLEGISNTTRIEKGTDGTTSGPAAPTPPAGKAQILVDTSATVDALDTFGVYLLGDGSCAPPINGDPNEPGVPLVFAGYLHGTAEQFSVFDVEPGTLDLSLSVWKTSTPPTCKQLKPTSQSTSVDIQAGQQVELYGYGTSLKDLHLVAAAPVEQ